MDAHDRDKQDSVDPEDYEDPSTITEEKPRERIGSDASDITEETSTDAPEVERQNDEAQEEKDLGLARTTSTSSKPVPVVKIPKSKSTGFLARFAIVYEAEEPKDYPRKIKWLITFWVAMAAMTAPMGSSIILPALSDINRSFDSTLTITNLSIALYMLSMSVFPLWWSSFSETAGRRTVYIVSFVLYTVFNVLAALSTSIGMFIAFRFLSGGCSASVQAVGAGTIADIWHVFERGRAMGIFYLGPLMGPLLAPIIGGALSQGLGWRSTQWFQVIYGGIMILGIVLCLAETHRTKPLVTDPVPREEGAESNQGNGNGPPSMVSRVSSRQSVAIAKSKKLALIIHRVFIEPLKITKYLRFPAVALTIYYASIAFGALYFLNISVEKTFSSPPYNFQIIYVGLLYVSNSLGYFVTAILGGRWVDKIMAREARKAGRIDSRGKLQYLPEDRMRENAWCGAIIMPAALLWYGWTAEKGVYWLAPIVANFFFGAGSMLIFGMTVTMLTEMMPKNASNGVALNNFIRNLFSFAASFLAEPLINAIGNGWLFTILGIVAFLSSAVIFVMKKWGPKFREQMDKGMD